MSITQEIRAKLDLVQYISQSGVPLRKAGRYFTACCPFHSEKTPSFVVFPETQTWHCFGACSTGGDIFTFVQRRENVDFAEALRILAEKAGVQLQPRTPEQRQREAHLDKLRSLLNEVARFYHQRLLNAPDAAEARAYVARRGLSEATLVQFQIGYAPDSWSTVLDRLKQIGYTERDMLEAGILTRHDDSERVYDRFRDRLMIPICDERGQVIGFGARALKPEAQPKYLNSPQTPLFDKSAVLFALHHARRSIRESETAVIVEGYMDAIQAHQHGFTNVVAQMGTALTQAQLKTLSRFARRLILALDADEAGARATLRGLEAARQAASVERVFVDPNGALRESSRLNLELQVVTLPVGKDPDDLIRDDPQAWRNLVAEAQGVAEYVINTAAARLPANATLAEREKVARELLPLLMATENNLQQQANVQHLAYKLRLGSGKALLEWAAQQQRLKRIDRPAADGKPSAPAQPNTGQAALTLTAHGEALQEYCLAALLQHPNLLADVQRVFRQLINENAAAESALQPLCAADFTRPDLRAIFEVFVRARAQYEEDWLAYLEAHLPAELQPVLEQLLVAHLEAYEQRLRSATELYPRALSKDVATLREQVSLHSDTVRHRTALLHHVLLLRLARLRRESAELSHLMQEADEVRLRDYLRLSTVYLHAIRALSQAMHAQPILNSQSFS
ncbi:MAG: DNA primase [Anaerolineae bacterium]|nr:DNA primase [Anaerolineae bacterium]